MATTFLNDTFTDTNAVLLENHTGETGATWTKHGSFASGSFTVQTNRIYQSANPSLYYASGTPSLANYYIESVVRIVSTAACDLFVCCGRINTGANTKYYISYNTLADGVSPGIKLRKTVNGTDTALGTGFYVQPGGFNVGQDYTFKLDMNGSTIDAYIDGVLVLTATDSSITATGRAGVSGGSPNGTTTTRAHIASITGVTNDTPATAITMAGPTVSTINQASSPFTVALSPTGGTTSGNVTVTPADGGAGGTFTPSTVTLATNTQSATFTYTGVSATTITISITNDGSLSNPSNISLSVQNNQVIFPNDANLVYSPYNWKFNSSTSSITNNNHAYIKMAFTGTTLKVTTSVASLVAASVTAGLYPTLYYVIDAGALQSTQLTSSSATVTLATGLTVGNHRLRLWWQTNSNAYDMWVTPSMCFTFTGFVLDAAASTITAFNEITQETKRALFYGDSITQGFSKSSVSHYPNIVGHAIGAEVGVVGWSGQAWNIAGQTNPPSFATSPGTWNQLWDGVSRSFSPEPDYVFVNEGTNGTPSTASITSWITSFRSSCPNAWLFVIIPFGQYNASLIYQGVSDYMVSHKSEAKIKVIDLGINNSYGLDATSRANGVPTWLTADGLHPNDQGNAWLGASLVPQIKAFIGSPQFTFNNSILTNVRIGQ